ncbi:MAG: MFS transporter [Oscillospiraceae bacterium]|nr:MFS transporter [Oscillospiraceae bacterium]
MKQEYKVYSYRWVVLVVYLLTAAVLQLLWATFFSVTTTAWQYYGFENAATGESAINLLSIIFMVGMIAFSFPAMAAYEKWGFKRVVGLSAVLMAVSAVARGAFGASYQAVVISTCGFALAQPFILNAPGLVAGKWFPENERATANGVGLLANYVGMAVGLLVTPLLLAGGGNIPGMLRIYGAAAAAVTILFLVFAKEKPATPPCSEADAKRSDFKEGMKTALKKKDFVVSIILFFCILGVFNTFFTMIEPLISSMTDGAVDATGSGIVGVVVLIVGIVGSFVISMISDKDKRRRRLPYMILSSLLGIVGLILFMVLGGLGGMITAGALYGFFIIGSAPVVLTFAAESAYPTSEGTSEGLLMFAGNVGGVVFLGAASLLGGNHAAVMIGMIAISAICVLLMLGAKETKLTAAAKK